MIRLSSCSYRMTRSAEAAAALDAAALPEAALADADALAALVEAALALVAAALVEVALALVLVAAALPEPEPEPLAAADDDPDELEHAASPIARASTAAQAKMDRILERFMVKPPLSSLPRTTMRLSSAAISCSYVHLRHILSRFVRRVQARTR